jgi:hypothetical protein
MLLRRRKKTAFFRGSEGFQDEQLVNTSVFG